MGTYYPEKENGIASDITNSRRRTLLSSRAPRGNGMGWAVIMVVIRMWMTHIFWPREVMARAGRRRSRWPRLLGSGRGRREGRVVLGVIGRMRGIGVDVGCRQIRMLHKATRTGWRRRGRSSRGSRWRRWVESTTGLMRRRGWCIIVIVRVVRRLVFVTCFTCQLRTSLVSRSVMHTPSLTVTGPPGFRSFPSLFTSIQRPVS